MRTPAPSPVLTSQPQAPRCFRFSSATMPSWTILCDFSPFSRTMKPTPQESCSYRGLYKPLVWWVHLSAIRSEEHTSELQSPYDLVCRLLLETKNCANALSELLFSPQLCFSLFTTPPSCSACCLPSVSFHASLDR